MPQPLIQARDLFKWFPIRAGFISSIIRGQRQFVKAVDGVDLEIYPKEILALAGESGCGKTTTGRTLLRLEDPTKGAILFEDMDIAPLDAKGLKSFRRKAQMIFQDPYESLNSRMTVYDIVSEPLTVHRLASTEAEKREMVIKSLEEVKLTPPEDFLFRFPHELSGGQRQRVAVARALILKPKFIVADEPVSMLDLSIRAGILNLMLELRETHDLTYLLITHDLAVAKYIADRIAIMYLGKVVEHGAAEEVVDNPLHPYTQALLAAVPVPDPRVKIGEIPIRGEVGSAAAIPPGCRFHTRCPYAMDVCKTVEPHFVEARKGHYVACHLLDGKQA